MTAQRFTLLAVLTVIAAAELPEGISYALAVVGVITAVFAILPPLVGFVGLLSRKPLDQIRDDMTFAAVASVPIALLAALALIIYLVGS